MGDNAAVETIFGLIVLVPSLIGPALIVALLIVAAPTLGRRRPVTRECRIAALLLVVLCLFWALQPTGWFPDLGAYGVVLTAGLIGSAVPTLTADRLGPAASGDGSGD